MSNPVISFSSFAGGPWMKETSFGETKVEEFVHAPIDGVWGVYSLIDGDMENLIFVRLCTDEEIEDALYWWNYSPEEELYFPDPFFEF